MKKSDCKQKWKKWRKEYRKEIAHLKSLLDQEMADHAACREALQYVNWQFNNRLKAEVAAGFRDGKTLEWNNE